MNAVAVNGADLVAIKQLMARYCHAFDSGDAEGWASCFEPDGLFVIDDQHHVRGRGSLVEFARAVGSREALRHWTASLLITSCDGLTATVESYQLTLALPRSRRGQALIRRIAGPRSRLVKRDGRWSFASREARVEVELV
jgi:uncharacterized protein (TIGR02246 family)